MYTLVRRERLVGNNTGRKADMEEGPCQFYRITILEAKSEPKFMPTGAVSFKVGWAWAALEVAPDDSKENEQADFHPCKCSAKGRKMLRCTAIAHGNPRVFKFRAKP